MAGCTNVNAYSLAEVLVVVNPLLVERLVAVLALDPRNRGMMLALMVAGLPTHPI